MTQLITSIILLALSLPAFAEDNSIRYRGQYTYGHEVNTFCPSINSQCYWLSPDTAPSQREQLRQLSQDNTSKPYQAICVVVEGRINRDPAARNNIGFATRYDGLFTVFRVFNLCNKTSIVTQGDLQHHRWLLESINGSKIDAEELDYKIPELDFGEQMTVSGNTGCNKFRGQAGLQDENFAIDPMQFTMMRCSPQQNVLESLLKQVLDSDSKITIDYKKRLLLKAGDTLLEYRLKDWVN
ncbi:MAG: META domain-containing protein [Gammaproteobacteria bacterium]|nr:META domain-containing protein [Gammaproteobacteria bacterium]